MIEDMSGGETPEQKKIRETGDAIKHLKELIDMHERALQQPPYPLGPKDPTKVKVRIDKLKDELKTLEEELEELQKPNP